jgi:hypothetical protein
VATSGHGVLPTSRLLYLASAFYKNSVFFAHLALITSQHKPPTSLSSPSTITMHLTSLLVLASSASAITMPNFLDLAQLFPRKSSACPSVWSSISSELTQNFLSGGQCNANARAAIRAVFHDCGGKPLISVSPPQSIYSHKTTAWQASLGANNGCDGSLATAAELGRSENRGLANIVTYLQNLAKSHKVSVADMIGKLASPFLQPPSSLTHAPQSSPATTPS